MFRFTLDFLKLFNRSLKLDFLLIITGSFFSGVLELFGIMLILPFVQVAMNPSSVENSQVLLYLYNLLEMNDYSMMIYLVGFLCGLCFILKDIYMLGFQYFQFSLVTKWRNELSEDFMSLYLGLNYRFHLRQASSAIINTLTSTISVAVNGYLLQVLFLISYSIVALCLVVYMIFSFPESTGITSICLISLVLVQIKFLKRANRKISKESVKIREENLGNLKQGIEAIKETKMFLREEYFSELFKLSNRRVTDNERRMNLVQHIPLYLTEIIIILSIIVLVCTTVYFSDGTTSAFSGVAILVAIAFRLTPVINRLLTSYSQIRASRESIKMLLKEHSEISTQQDVFKSQVQGTLNTFEHSISLKNVFFSYNDIMQIFDVSFDVRKGEFIGIVGQSGSGKTTVVDILMGLLKPRMGKVLIDGKSVTEELSRKLRSNIGYVPQSPFIGDMSVRNNVAYGIKEELIDDERIIEVLKLVNLYDFFSDKPEGLQFNLGEGGKSLSGGQKQRVAIARALYNKPEIIVLDEATSALDVISESEVSSAISNLKGKTTIIAIAHRLSTIRKSDKILLFNLGRLEEVGSFSELERSNPNFKRLVELSKI